MEKKDYNNKNVSSKNEPFFFTKFATSWSLVIFGNYPSDALTFLTS